LIGTQEELDADEEAMGAERASDYRKELTAAHARVCQSGGSCRWSLGGFSKCLSPEVNCARPTTGLISESPSPFDEDVLLRLLMLQRVVDLRHCSFACKAWNRACQTNPNPNPNPNPPSLVRPGTGLVRQSPFGDIIIPRGGSS